MNFWDWITSLSTAEIIRLLGTGAEKPPLSRLVGELVERIRTSGDQQAEETIIALLGTGDSAQRYISYCSLKEMELSSGSLAAAVQAFEKDPVNKRLITYWSECCS